MGDQRSDFSGFGCVFEESDFKLIFDRRKPSFKHISSPSMSPSHTVRVSSFVFDGKSDRKIRTEKYPHKFLTNIKFDLKLTSGLEYFL